MREAVMAGGKSVFFSPPPFGGGGAATTGAGGGSLRLGELCENVLQYGGRLSQHVIVPVTRDPKTFGHQEGISRCITLGVSMLTTIDFDDELLFETHEVENE